MLSNESRLEEVSTKVNILIGVVAVLALILFAFVIIECVRLVYSLIKKKKSYGDPKKVVVKSDKSKRADKSGKKHSDKSSKKRSKSSSRKQKKPKSKRVSKTSQSSAKSSVASDKVEKQPEKKSLASSKISAQAVAGSKPNFGESGSTWKTPLQRVVPGTEASRTKPLFAEFAAPASDEKTEEQVRRIPNQFVSPITGRSLRDLDAASNDTKTEDQIRRIPQQFPPTPKPDLRSNLESLRLSDRAINQVAAAIVAELANKQVTPRTYSYGKPEEVTPLSTPDSQKEPLSKPVQVGVPQYQAPQPQVVRQQQYPMAGWTRGVPADSVYIMENVGPNGEIQKADLPVEANANNSLMVDAQNMVPIANQGANKPSGSGTAP